MFRRFLLAIVLLLGSGCVSTAPPRPSAADPAVVERIKAGVAKLRGLEFKSEVPIEVKSRAEMGAAFERQIAEDYGEERLAKLSLAYGRLGLIPQNIDLKKTLLQFYASEVVAYYDSQAKKLVMPDRAAGAGEDMPLVLAHELTHALQDQHFPVLGNLIHASDDDADLALHAIVEGDALLSGYAYIGAGTKEFYALGRALEAGMRESQAALRDVPRALVEEMFFPYYGGATFLAPLLAEGGWRDVDAVYSSPPLSTEQILHPEKYFTAPDPPTRVDFGDLAALVPADWKEIENNIMGEFMIRVLFEQYLTKDEARAAAEGWDGDRFVAYTRGSDIAFMWASVWDSETDAEEFIAAYRRLVEKRASGGYAYIERRGARALIVEGIDREGVSGAIEKVWNGIQMKEEPFTAPRFGAQPPTPAAAPLSQ